MLTDDPQVTQAMAAAAQNAAQKADTTGVVLSEIVQIDSVNQAVKDSLANITSLTDVKDIVTGQNPILNDALSSLVDITVGFVPKLIGAILVLWIGFKLIKMLKRALTKVLDKRQAERSLSGFLTSFLDVLLKIMLIIMAMDIIGIKATSFIAILGAMGLAVGMALQGTLQNFAGGVIILLLKPFKVGDYIECGNYKGYVKDIHIFNTIIRPFNGRIIVVPNSSLATTSLTNHTKEAEIRMSIDVGVAYGSDLNKVREVLQKVLDDDPLIIHEPRTHFACVKLNESSVDYTLWIWTKTENYWTVWERINENVYNAFYENGIEIPFNQLDVHLDK